MASFEGNWQQVSTTNEDKCLQLLGCPPEFAAMVSRPLLQLSIARSSNGWDWTATVNQFSAKTNIEVGQAHSIGKHAPNYQAVPSSVTDTEIQEDIVDLNGQKVGEMRFEVSGEDMSCITTIRDVQGVSKFKRN